MAVLEPRLPSTFTYAPFLFPRFIPFSDSQVFDTANVHDGKAYGLSFHLDRLYKSAAQARIEHAFPRAHAKAAILATIAASGAREGVFARYWLSAGRGDFNVSPRGLQHCGVIPGSEASFQGTFYAIVHRSGGKDAHSGGIAEVTVKVPLKTQLLATMKSNNYLLNALTAMEAEDMGGMQGIQVDDNGCLVESAVACVAIVTKDGVLKAPPFDHTLASTTVVRGFDLAREHLVSHGSLRDVVQESIPVEEAYGAAEMFSLGGGGIVPIVHLDGRQLGDGKPGPIFRQMSKLLHDELSNPEFIDAVPYEEFATTPTTQ